MPQILLVEDSATQARTVMGPLDKTEFNVQLATNLQEGVEQARRRAFDAVILDLHLPDSDGLNTFLQMQQSAPRTPIVILTSTADEELAHRLLRSGAQDYLIKGEVTPEWIVRALRYSMERFAAQAPAVADQGPPEPALQLTLDRVGDVTIVRVDTKKLLGSDLLEELSSRLFRLVDEQSQRKFILDCAQVDYVSNSVLAQLLVWDKKIRQHGGSMRICSLRKSVQDQIKVRKLLAQFDICLDEENALKDF